MPHTVIWIALYSYSRVRLDEPELCLSELAQVSLCVVLIVPNFGPSAVLYGFYLDCEKESEKSLPMLANLTPC